MCVWSEEVGVWVGEGWGGREGCGIYENIHVVTIRTTTIGLVIKDDKNV